MPVATKSVDTFERVIFDDYRPKNALMRREFAPERGRGPDYHALLRLLGNIRFLAENPAVSERRAALGCRGCYARVESLAFHSEIHRNSVRAGCNILEAHGWLKQEKRKGNVMDRWITPAAEPFLREIISVSGENEAARLQRQWFPHEAGLQIQHQDAPVPAAQESRAQDYADPRTSLESGRTNLGGTNRNPKQDLNRNKESTGPAAGEQPRQAGTARENELSHRRLLFLFGETFYEIALNQCAGEGQNITARALHTKLQYFVQRVQNGRRDTARAESEEKPSHETHPEAVGLIEFSRRVHKWATGKELFEPAIDRTAQEQFTTGLLNRGFSPAWIRGLLVALGRAQKAGVWCFASGAILPARLKAKAIQDLMEPDPKWKLRPAEPYESNDLPDSPRAVSEPRPEVRRTVPERKPAPDRVRSLLARECRRRGKEPTEKHLAALKRRPELISAESILAELAGLLNIPKHRLSGPDHFAGVKNGTVYFRGYVARYVIPRAKEALPLLNFELKEASPVIPDTPGPETSLNPAPEPAETGLVSTADFRVELARRGWLSDSMTTADGEETQSVALQPAARILPGEDRRDLPLKPRRKTSRRSERVAGAVFRSMSVPTGIARASPG